MQRSVSSVEVHPVKMTVSRYPRHHLTHVLIPDEKIDCRAQAVTNWLVAHFDFARCVLIELWCDPASNLPSQGSPRKPAMSIRTRPSRDTDSGIRTWRLVPGIALSG